MTPLSPARRDAEAFARAVDGHGEVADRYSDLLTCVDVLRDQEIPAPRNDFVADLRMRLMDAADTLLLPADAKLAPVVPIRTVAPANRRQRRISIAAAAFVVIGGTAGVAAAAESALPGDALYPLKRGIESAQVSLNASDSGKGQDLLRAANTRLDEVDGLMAQDESASEITHTLSSFERSAADGADLLFVAYQRDGDPDDIARLRTMLGSQLTKLDTLATDAPTGAQPAFDSAKQLLSDLDQQASVLCSDCGPGGISDRLNPVSSAPALGSLFNVPVIRAEHKAAAEARAQALADRAAQIAKNTKQNQPTSGTDVTDPSVDPTEGPTPGLPVETPRIGGLGGVVGGLTSGVSALLGGGGGGTPLAPLTDTLNDTLGILTGLLP
jgi:hypothetical protein